MPSYYFRVRTPDKAPHRIERHELPNLDAAMAMGQRTARALVRNPLRRGRTSFGGSLSIEIEGNQPIAQIMLADVARQMS